jgi:hypothetical protein
MSDIGVHRSNRSLHNSMTASLFTEPAALSRVDTAAGWGWRFVSIIVITLLLSIPLGFQVGVSILTVVGILATLAGIAHPVIGMYGIGMLCVLDSVTRVLLMTGGLFRYNTFNYLLLLAMLLCIPILKGLADRQTRILLAFLLFMVLGLLISPDIAAGSFGILNVTAEVGLLLYFIRGIRSGMNLYWLAVVNGVLAALACCVFFGQVSSVRYVNPNAWSYMPVTALFSICLGYGTAKESGQQYVLLALSLLNFCCVVLSASRGSMLVALICVLFLMFSAGSGAVRLFYVGVGAAILIIGGSLFTNMRDYAMHRVGKLFDDRYSIEGRTSGRSELAAAGLMMFRQNPLGRGTGAFAAELVEVEGYSKQSHSGWIKTMAENGIIGLALLVSFIGSFLITGLEKPRGSEMRAIGFLTMMALSVALFSTEFNAKGLWFLAAGATTILSYRRSAVSASFPIR